MLSNKKIPISWYMKEPMKCVRFAGKLTDIAATKPIVLAYDTMDPTTSTGYDDYIIICPDKTFTITWKKLLTEYYDAKKVGINAGADHIFLESIEKIQLNKLKEGKYHFDKKLKNILIKNYHIMPIYLANTGS